MKIYYKFCFCECKTSILHFKTTHLINLYLIIFAFIVSFLIAMDENDLNFSDHAPTNSKSSSYLDKRLGANLDINDLTPTNKNLTLTSKNLTPD